MTWNGAQEGRILFDPETNPQSLDGDTRSCRRCGKMMCQCSPRGGFMTQKEKDKKYDRN